MRHFQSASLRTIAILLILSILSLTSCLAPQTNNRNSLSGPSTFADVVDKVMPSVVYIYVEIETVRPGQVAAGSGSGVILSSDGYVLTNRHVVENARRAEVTLQNRTAYEATTIWVDDLLDLAVIKIEGKELPAARFGDPEKVRVGDWAIALGHPLGLSPSEGGATVTVGIVSNLGRSFSLQGIPFYDIIQTDAAINPGNSGGPLVNMDGEVIGINTAGAGEAQNINFAINVATAKRVFEDIVQYGRVVRPYLGAALDDISPSMINSDSLTKRSGAIVVRVEPNGPAQQAGLKQYDIITGFGGVEITSAAQLIKELWKHKVGETVAVIYWRGETEEETTLALTERPSTK
jgi:serine protease Do